MNPFCINSSIILILLLNDNVPVVPNLRDPIIISNSFNNSVGLLLYSIIELSHLQGLIIFLNFDDVLCNGKYHNSVRSLNKSSDSFEYVFFELYLLIISFIKFWLIIISESLLTTNLLKPFS